MNLYLRNDTRKRRSAAMILDMEATRGHRPLTRVAFVPTALELLQADVIAEGIDPEHIELAWFDSLQMFDLIWIRPGCSLKDGTTRTFEPFVRQVDRDGNVVFHPNVVR
jgi:hypothetical protein